MEATDIEVGDEVEVFAKTGGFKVGKVVAVSESIEDRTAGVLIESVYGSGRERVIESDINRVLG